MWKQIKISEHTFFICCKITDGEVEFVVYNLKEGWSETQNSDASFIRAKKLNKRIQYSKPVILNALQNEQPVQANWEEQSDNMARTLVLKYRIGACPFHFEWCLRRQSEEELQRFIIMPLFETVHGMSQQIAELREVVRKKDLELEQFKKEGVTLRRKTLATQPFEFTEFDEKFSSTNALAKGFEMIAQTLMQESNSVAEPASKSEVSVNMKPETNEASPTKEEGKINVRTRRRKALQLKERHMQMKLEASKKQKITYENSQTQSDSTPQNSDVMPPEKEVHEEKEADQTLPDIEDKEENLIRLYVNGTSEFAATDAPVRPMGVAAPTVQPEGETTAHSPDLSEALASIQVALQELEKRRLADLQNRSMRSS